MPKLKKVFEIEWEEPKNNLMTIDVETLEMILNTSITGCNNIKIQQIKPEKGKQYEK